MKQIFRNLIVIIAMVLITVPSFGWGRRVHAAIAYIAEQNLTPKAKKTVDEILEGKTMSYTHHGLTITEQRCRSLTPRMELHIRATFLTHSR
jgi:hypothetical protein